MKALIIGAPVVLCFFIFMMWQWSEYRKLSSSTDIPPTNIAEEESYVPRVEPEPAKPNKPLFTGISWGSDNFSTTIEGVFHNTTGQKISYMQISFGLYDSEGNKVGNAFDNITDLRPGDSWKFKAIGMNGNVSSIKLDDISGL